MSLGEHYPRPRALVAPPCRCGRDMLNVGTGVWLCPHDHRTDPPTEREAPRFPDIPRFEGRPVMGDVSLPPASHMTAPIAPPAQPALRPAEQEMARRRPNASDEQIVAAYERLRSIKKVCHELRVRREVATRALHRAGVSYESGVRQRATDAEIREAYDRLGSKKGVCDELGVGWRTVVRALSSEEMAA